MKDARLDIKPGELVYPHFDCFWRQNQPRHSAWSAIRMEKTADGKFVTRIIRDWNSGTGDHRMAGKLMYLDTLHGGLVVFVEGIQENINAVRLEKPPYMKGRYDVHELWALPTDPKVLGLKITRVAKSCAWAEVVEVMLPEESKGSD